MKMGIKKCMIWVAGLMAFQVAFGMTQKEREALAKRVSSTKVTNLANGPIVVKGLGGSSWTIKSHGTTTFQTGLQDNLAIEIGVPPLATAYFDMTQFKPHFAEIVEAKYIPNGTLQIYGRLRLNSAKKNETMDEDWHLEQLQNYCKALGCEITQKVVKSRYCTISNIRPVQTKQGVREDFKGALDTTTRITHPTKFTNATNTNIEVKGALGLSTSMQPRKTASFQTGLQDNLKINYRKSFDSERGDSWRTLEFNLKPVKDQFTWIQSAELVENASFVQGRTGPEHVSSYTLTLHGIPKRDVPSDKGLSRKTMLKDSCVGCDVTSVQDGTISVLGIQPRKQKE